MHTDPLQEAQLSGILLTPGLVHGPRFLLNSPVSDSQDRGVFPAVTRMMTHSTSSFACSGRCEGCLFLHENTVIPTVANSVGLNAA
jgi:hypothetical protein